MKPTAVIGAGGFVGSRWVERSILSDGRPLRAVVRSPRSMASLCRFGAALDTRIADAAEVDSLAEALAGCEAAVNLVTGPPDLIRRTSNTILEACRAQGIRRMVHLSSATVFGDQRVGDVADVPPEGERLWMPYARAKLDSEVYLRQEMGESLPEVVVLRPGLVWGPGSSWAIETIRSLQSGSAFLVGDGGGIFNGIYVDNLIDCIEACLRFDGEVSGFFNVVDAEHLTWRSFLLRLANGLGLNEGHLGRVSEQRQPRSLLSVLDLIQGSPLTGGLYFWLKDNVPLGVKATIKTFFESRSGDYCYDRVAREPAANPAVSRELWSLQKIRFRLCDDAFRERFEIDDAVSFEEGMRRTLMWAQTMGYPVEVR